MEHKYKIVYTNGLACDERGYRESATTASTLANARKVAADHAHRTAQPVHVYRINKTCPNRWLEVWAV